MNAPPDPTAAAPFELQADAQLVHLLADRFYEDHGIDLGDDRTALLRLLQAARSARRDLLAADHAEVSIPQIATDADGRPLSLTDTITRRDQRQAQANEDVWDTRDKLEAILFDQGMRPAPASSTPVVAYAAATAVARARSSLWSTWGRSIVARTSVAPAPKRNARVRAIVARSVGVVP